MVFRDHKQEERAFEINNSALCRRYQVPIVNEEKGMPGIDVLRVCNRDFGSRLEVRLSGGS